MIAPKLDLSGEQQEQLQELSSDQVAYLREKAKTDLYFLAKGVLGYDQLEPGAHGALCQFMVYEESNRRMVLMPRGYLKSTICTIADSIRLSLKDPNVRILIQNEVFDNASGFLEEIKQHWMRGKLLRFLFPELIPTKIVGQGADWSKDAASVNRDTVKKESTYTAAGSGGSPQSQHFEKIKNDDLVGEKAKDSPAEMARAIRWAGGMVPLLDRLTDVIDFYGTRKTLADVYSHVWEMYKSRIAVFIREPIENGKSIFGKVPLEELMRIMTDTPDVWAHDFMNNPVGKGGLDWGKGLLRSYAYTNDLQRIVIEDHLSGLTVFWALHELDVVITIDPNSGKLAAPDKAAIIVHGVTPRDQIIVLDTWSGRVQPDDFINQIWEMAYRWRPRVLGFEDAGQQNTKFYFEKKCREEGLYYRIQDLKHDNKTKEPRIRAAIDTPLKARRIYVLPSMLTLIGQVQLFPQLAAHNWDELDCFSYGPQLYQTGVSDKEQKEAEEAEALLMAMRGVTGYGASV